jgi:hypothetical protein
MGWMTGIGFPIGTRIFHFDSRFRLASYIISQKPLHFDVIQQEAGLNVK